MARIRTVKPEFFRHEGLQDLEEKQPKLKPMLVFEGLWTVSDKNGIFEWRPRQLKLDILPFVTFNMEQTLSILSDSGYIIPFEHAGKQYGIIPTFKDHQRITGTEAKSSGKFPIPDEETLKKRQGNTKETPEQQQGRLEREREKEREKERERSIGVSDQDRLPPTPAPFIMIPLNDKTEYPIQQDHIDEWKALFPKVDVEQELRNIRAWNLSNEKLRKTRGGILQHITSWLTKEQNRGGNNGNGNGSRHPGSGTGKAHQKASGARSDEQPYPVDGTCTE